MRPTMWNLIAAVAVVGLGADAAAADPAAAKKANNAGMKAYKRGDYEAAQKLFETAIAEDPGFVKAHYNRASMAALQGSLDPLREEFAWLRASTQPEAARVLAKSKTDPDFDGMRTVDAAREAMGLPPLADTPLDQLVLAGGGWWSGVDMGMMAGWLDYHFAPKGKVTAREHSGESGTWATLPVTWKIADRTVVIAGRGWKAVWQLTDCPDPLVDGQQCLVSENKSLSPGRFRAIDD